MSGVSIASGVSADLPLLYLDCRDTSASITLPTTPTVWALPIIASQSNIGYDTSTGIITFYSAGVYSVFTSLNVHTTATQSIYAFAEINTPGGWVPSQYSGRRVQINGNIDGQVLTVSRNFFGAGTQLRLKFHTTGVVTAQTTDVPNTTPGTVTVPAYRLMVAS
jgi:hypothetical protein